MSEIALYQDDNSSIEVLLEQDTLWISQEHMALLFQVQKAAISKHLKNIYASGELERAATVSKMETVQQEGLRPGPERDPHSTDHEYAGSGSLNERSRNPSRTY